MKLHEMDGFLKGKCLPGDMLVNETNAEYLVRKFAELQSALDVQSARSDALEAELKQSKIDAECYKHGMEQSNKRLTEIAAENTALKSAGYELLGEACAVYAKLNKLINPEIGDFVDGQTLHEFQFLLDTGTTNTDAWVNEQRAKEAKHIYESILDNPSITDMESLVDWLEQYANDSISNAAQLRGAENVPVERLLLNKLQEGRA